MSHIFIGGSGRCGTSVLGLALAEHPGVVYFGETRLFRYLIPFLRGETTSERFQVRMGVTRNYLVGPGPRRVYTRAFLDQLLAEFLDGIWDDGLVAAKHFVDNLFGALAKRTGRTYWIEKTPHTCRFANDLYRLFPDMRYIHIIREPKDVCASVVSVDWAPDNVPNAVNSYYMQVMTGAWVARQEIPAENYTVISLESLVAKPREVLGHALRFAGIPADDQMLTRMAMVVDPSLAHIGRWREDLSAEEAALVNEKCGPLYGRWKDVEAEYV